MNNKFIIVGLVAILFCLVGYAQTKSNEQERFDVMAVDASSFGFQSRDVDVDFKNNIDVVGNVPKFPLDCIDIYQGHKVVALRLFKWKNVAMQGSLNNKTYHHLNGEYYMEVGVYNTVRQCATERIDFLNKMESEGKQHGVNTEKCVQGRFSLEQLLACKLNKINQNSVKLSKSNDSQVNNTSQTKGKKTDNKPIRPKNIAKTKGGVKPITKNDDVQVDGNCNDQSCLDANVARELRKQKQKKNKK